MFEIRPILSAMLQHKSRAVLIILQMALTLAIVSNALFIIDQRVQLMNRDTGIPDGQTFSFAMVALDGMADLNQQVEVDEQILRDIPGVIDAVTTNAVPLQGSGSGSSLSLEDKPDAGEFPTGVFRGDEHLLNTLGVELLEGRNFTANEVAYNNQQSDSVVIVNQSLATKMFPNGDALGKTVYSQGKPSKIVGIVGIMQGSWVDWRGFNENVIFPSVGVGAFVRYMVRTNVEDRQAVMEQVEQKLLGSFAQRVFSSLETHEQHIEKAYGQHNAMRVVLTVIIVLLIFVTVVGIFGLSAFSVNQRTKQIGTRRALGASQFDITRYFLVEIGLMALVGISIGCILALGLNYFLVNQYGVRQLNKAYVAGTMFAILLVSLAAVLIPALKAAKISPAMATR